MSKPVSTQKLSVICSRLVLRKYLVAAASFLLAASIGAYPALAKDSKKEAKTTADSKAAVIAEDPAWDAYVDDLEKQVLEKWFPPGGIDQYKAVRVEIRVRKDGRLSNTEITKSSQIDTVDDAAKKAVTDAAPFKPFPESVKKEDFARFEVKFDKSDVGFKRRIVRKIDKFSKPERDDPKTKQSF